MRILLIIILTFIPSAIWSQTNTFDFDIVKDTLSSNAMLDLRYMNESVAGEHGFIKLSGDGNSFVDSHGNSVRFWAANVSRNLLDRNANTADTMARYLAKMGFNMVRFHGSLNPKWNHSSINDVDTVEIDRIWRLVAAMKKQGIYLTISPYWAHADHLGGNIPAEWGIDGVSGKADLWGQIFFNEKLQNAYKCWVKKLYTQINPYTGIALKDDPAVAIIQIQNEDGVFFWTMNKLKPAFKKLVQKKFADWLIAKYGSLPNALMKWGNEPVVDDDIPANLVGLYSIYDMTIEQSGNKSLRLKDQVQFYAETQYNFNKEIHDYYRNELGCKQLINASNWRPASIQRLNDLERWTHTSAEVIATNRYQDPGHIGTNSGWRIDTGHYYEGKSTLLHPENLAINMKQVTGHPMMITEGGWNLPSKYQVEGPFLIANYQSLTGVDAYYWYVFSDFGISSNPYFSFTCKNDTNCAIQKWNQCIPGIMSMMPANALTYRLGYIKEATNVISEKRVFSDLLDRKLPFISEETSFDPNRDNGFNTSKKESNTCISALAFLTGRVSVSYDATKSKVSVSKQLKQKSDEKLQAVSSVTNELNLNYQQGICTSNSACSQGVCGFLNKQKHFVLKDVVIDSNNEYASIQVVSLDKKKIADSQKLLLQVGTLYLPTDWQENATTFLNSESKKVSGFRIENTGHMPWKCQQVNATVTIHNNLLSRAYILNSAGYFLRNVALEKSKNSVRIDLPMDAMYLILE